jgi:serine/threonine protein phosphatase PrpC
MTDVGVVRDHNEDAALVDEHSDFFVVADGMGGHAAGEVASAMAVETVCEELASAREEIESFAGAPSDRGRKELVSILESAVRKAHNDVYTRGVKEPDKQGMGTTLDVVLLAGPEAFVAHVGDSRTYLIRDGKAAQITTDHTVAEVLVIEGKLSLEEAQLSPLRTILVNAIGVAPDVGVEMAHVRLRKDDILLLCSDGLHDYFPAEQELAQHTVDNDPDKALGRMIELAKSRGGHDNITGIIVEVLEAPDELTLSPFETDLTQPVATAVSDGVPQPIASGDTQPHELREDTEEIVVAVEDVVLDDHDIKATLPLRPSKRPKVRSRSATDDTEEVPKFDPSAEELARKSPVANEVDDDAGDEPEAARQKLARASTEPPIAPNEDEGADADADDNDENALTEEAVAVAEETEARQSNAKKMATAKPEPEIEEPEAKEPEAKEPEAKEPEAKEPEAKQPEPTKSNANGESSSKKRKKRKNRRKKKRAKKST